MTSQTSTIRPVVILGPTAGGKSELAVLLAQQLNGEIIGADSMQVYRHMNAGTAKPSKAQRSQIPHHMVDCVEPTESFSVHDWLAQVEPLIAQMQRQGKRPVLVGGTNLYLKALLEGLFQGPGADAAFRRSLRHQTPQQLHVKLEQIDPESARQIHPNDRKRLVRALEVYHLTGKPISCYQKQWATPRHTSGHRQGVSPYRYHPYLVGLRWDVAAINRRINARVKQMFYPQNGTQSLPEETRQLENAGLLGPQAREALGYKQVLEHFQGLYSLDDAMEKTKILTRRFAKQQRTWLKRFQGVLWIEAAASDPQQWAKQAIQAMRL